MSGASVDCSDPVPRPVHVSPGQLRALVIYKPLKSTMRAELWNQADDRVKLEYNSTDMIIVLLNRADTSAIVCDAKSFCALSEYN